ncbi:chord-domain-containing protein [Chytriomyces sp. MP71]|nr:chord-domain-containing protein [Chytriomyces sp. MP71]
MSTGGATIPCANKGCNQKFEPSENGPTSCEHHSGAPVFHDALKGWSCCEKRVTDFDDFIKIPGCTLGPHSAKAAEAAKKAPVAVAAAAKPSVIVDGKEVYGTPAPAPAQGAAVKIAETPVVAAVKEEDLHDALDAVIVKGTVCKRKTCGYTYQEEPECRTGECVYHSGSPIFHEGSKGWSCCSRKVLEFDEFLKIKGCKVGKHRFTEQEVTIAFSEVEEKVECRRDWYQTPSTVIVSIFAKKLDKAATTVEFFDDKISINAKFQDGKKYLETIPLALPIDPVASKFMVLTTKMELTLKKANGLSWPTLEIPADGVVLKSFTTFGVRDGNGQDAPLHLLNN